MSKYKNAIIMMIGQNSRGGMLRLCDAFNDPHDIGRTFTPMDINFRCACARSIGGIGFVMLYFEAPKKTVNLLKRPESIDALAERVNLLENASTLDEHESLDPMRIFIEDADDLIFDNPDNKKALQHTFLSFDNKDESGTLRSLCKAFARSGVFIAQHDSVIRRRTRNARRAICQQTFRLYVPKKIGGRRITKEDDLREYINSVIKTTLKDWRRVSKQRTLLTPSPERGLLPMNMAPSHILQDGEPTRGDIKGARFSYLVYLGRDATGLLRNLVNFMVRPYGRRASPYPLIRSTCRSLGGWACVVLCSVMPEPASEFKKRTFLSELRRKMQLGTTDILVHDIQPRRVLPDVEREIFNRVSFVKRAIPDSPYLLRRLLHHVHDEADGIDLDGQVNIVQYDAWSDSRKNRTTPQCSHALGILVPNNVDTQSYREHLELFQTQ